jgi:DMSO/TMAO reductase YedYZ heme-binding membrane subunit
MNQVWWYTARSGGLVAWALMAASVVWGLLLSTKVLNGKPRPNWILDLHRFLGGLAMIFTGVHVLAIIFDSYVHFGLVEVLVPFTGSWHPGAVAWGIVGMYLLAAVEVTSLVRKRLSKMVWHALHLLSFPVFVFTTIHVLTAGTDRTTLPVRLLLAAGAVLVAGLTLVRLRRMNAPDAQPQRRIPSVS